MKNLAILGLALLLLACEGSNGPMPGQPSMPPPVGGTSAPGVGATPGAAPGAVNTTCTFETGPVEGKIEQRLFDAYQSGVTVRKVTIQYAEDPVAELLPTCPPGERMCPARTQAIDAYQKAVEDAQVCVITRITTIGGEFLETGVIGNVTFARLTYEQLLDIASLTEVRMVSDAERVDFPD